MTFPQLFPNGIWTCVYRFPYEIKDALTLQKLSEYINICFPTNYKSAGTFPRYTYAIMLDLITEEEGCTSYKLKNVIDDTA